MYRVVVVVFLVLCGCQFDPSTSLPAYDGATGDATGGPSSCSTFVPEPCGQCGVQACTDTPSGPEIQCVADPQSTSCIDEDQCSAQGQCEAKVTCTSGIAQWCGECGTKYCENGLWSECEANDYECYVGLRCLPDSGGTVSCQAACSTEGHRTPYSEFGGGGGGSTIPDTVPLWQSWISTDGCQDEGEFRECACGIGDYGYPDVECHSCDDD